MSYYFEQRKIEEDQRRQHCVSQATTVGGPSILQRKAKGGGSAPVSVSAAPQTVAVQQPQQPKIRKPRKPKNPGSDADFSFTGLAEKFNCDGTYAYNGGLGWMRWDGGRYRQIEETEVMADLIAWATDQMVRAISDHDKDAEKAYYGMRNGQVGSVQRALEATAFVPMEKFDDKPWQLNCKNGTVDLKTGVLTPHQRTYSLRQCEAAYDPNADMTEWKKFVASIFPDHEMQHYVQVMFGYAVTGCVEEEMFSIFHGSGKNGKSTLCNIISHIIGDYSGEIPTSELAIRKNQQDNSPHMARQVGKRLIFANEPPDGMVLDDATIKKMGSRDKIAVCAKFKDPFDLHPSWLLVVRSNNRPQIRAIDDAVWRRVKEIPFSIRFDKPDKTIDKRMIEQHASAVLRWMVEGAMEYAQSHNFPACKIVDDACIAYRQESDTIEGWLADAVEADPKGFTELSTLWDSYTQWVGVNGGYPHSLKRLSDVLGKKGFLKVQNSRKSTFQGLKLVSK